MAEQSVQYHPGDTASAEQLLCLAGEFKNAAALLEQQGRPGAHLSRAPFRLSAIHAIELYLSAMLIHEGHDNSFVRSMPHNLEKLADATNLQLKERTKRHLSALIGSREYLVARYGPEMMEELSQINRITATLEEVAAKVSAIVNRAG